MAAAPMIMYPEIKRLTPSSADVAERHLDSQAVQLDKDEGGQEGGRRSYCEMETETEEPMKMLVGLVLLASALEVWFEIGFSFQDPVKGNG
ncbi:hypothetical protein C5167_035815 [Papaver somniferum]|nr:hypothetical protein C5167_035815 [Papaver somniferum]